MIDIKIIDSNVNDNTSLIDALVSGFRLVKAIPYINFSIKYNYDLNSTYERQDRTNEQPMIKYILERDGISRNIYG